MHLNGKASHILSLLLLSMHDGHLACNPDYDLNTKRITENNAEKTNKLKLDTIYNSRTFYPITVLGLVIPLQGYRVSTVTCIPVGRVDLPVFHL